jgi:hypothetical protein
MNAFTRRNVLHLSGLIAVSAWLGRATAVADDKVPLAIKGYDPVAYFTLGKAVAGSPSLEFEWDEHRYRFSRPEHREMFKATPERYAPQFTNVCAMALALGKIVEADPESWLISDGKLYVFGGPAGREMFQQTLAENIAKANRNRVLIQKR